MIPTKAPLACALFLAACSGPSDLTEQAGHASANLVVCPDGDTQEGIDVSAFQVTVAWDTKTKKQQAARPVRNFRG